MTTIRVVKSADDDFFTSTLHARGDRRLSWAARSVLMHLLSFPAGEMIPIRDLFYRTTDDDDLTRALLRELGMLGYLVKQATEPISYTVHERPVPDALSMNNAVGAARHFDRPSALRSTNGITALRVEDLNQLIAFYPAEKVPRDRAIIGDAWNDAVAAREAPEIQVVLGDLALRKGSYDWKRDGGRWIPNIMKYIRERMWTHPILPAPDDQRPKRDADWNSASRGGVVL